MAGFSLKLGQERHAGFGPQTSEEPQVLGNEMNPRNKTSHFCASFLLENAGLAYHIPNSWEQLRANTYLCWIFSENWVFKGEGVTIWTQVIWQDYVCKIKKKTTCHLSSLILWKDPDALAMCARLRESAWNAPSELDTCPSVPLRCITWNVPDISKENSTAIYRTSSFHPWEISFVLCPFRSIYAL